MEKYSRVTDNLGYAKEIASELIAQEIDFQFRKRSVDYLIQYQFTVQGKDYESFLAFLFDRYADNDDRQ